MLIDSSKHFLHFYTNCPEKLLCRRFLSFRQEVDFTTGGGGEDGSDNDDDEDEDEEDKRSTTRSVKARTMYLWVCVGLRAR